MTGKWVESRAAAQTSLRCRIEILGGSCGSGDRVMTGHLCDLCITQISLAAGTGESGVEEEGQDSGRSSQGLYGVLGASTAVASGESLRFVYLQQ